MGTWSSHFRTSCSISLLAACSVLTASLRDTGSACHQNRTRDTRSTAFNGTHYHVLIQSNTTGAQPEAVEDLRQADQATVSRLGRVCRRSRFRVCSEEYLETFAFANKGQDCNVSTFSRRARCSAYRHLSQTPICFRKEGKTSVCINHDADQNNANCFKDV